ncbi:MAG TPA: hypothetical protein PLG14_11540, partial [Spirochaetales bacterium]|nr:hypothetical protein [Spirochaetales bacterium]
MPRRLGLSPRRPAALPPFLWPIRGRVTSPWFFRHRPDSANPLALEFHDGLDIAAPAGTPGRVGSTGRSTGPHLHFELKAGGTSLPPRVLLAPHDLRR